MSTTKHRPTLTTESIVLICRALSTHIGALSGDQTTNLAEIVKTIKVKEYLDTFATMPAVADSTAALLAKYLGADSPAVAAQIAKAPAVTAPTTLTDAERHAIIGRKSSTERTDEETKFYLDYSMQQMLAISRQKEIDSNQL